ncbi:S8 family serine peptidase [Chelatococcus asaccharovorans]|uniref:S8 family serine peptidase n=1 Tax=Chelatococcus asaccharovorans TaxID=28210 RepID=UPI00224C7AB1|nr:S8 family serine peptidase [Chelatococcus asaccharovorans]CAH1673172.1 Subtilase family protein [Chelatococcus asaccharovorans]CAH1675438.1 Subtilase family protein [Chelatococcus asaccharovorans]
MIRTATCTQAPKPGKPLAGRLLAAAALTFVAGLSGLAIAHPAQAEALRSAGRGPLMAQASSRYPSDSDAPSRYDQRPERPPRGSYDTRRPPREPNYPVRPDRPWRPPGYGAPPIYGGPIVPPFVRPAPPPVFVDDDGFEAEPSPRRPRAVKPAKPPPQKAVKQPPARKPPAKTPARATPPVSPPAQVASDQFVTDEVLFEMSADAAAAEADAVAQRFNLTLLERRPIDLLGVTVIRARLPRGQTVPAMVRALTADQRVASAQPNHVFRLQQGDALPEEKPAPVAAPTAQPIAAPAADLASVQYALEALRLKPAQTIARGKGVTVAVIDSAIDGTHPELAGSLSPHSRARQPSPHGTGIAGIIAAHARMLGAAPDVRILGIDAFTETSGGASGTSLDVVSGLDTAVKHGAAIANLSFAGPRDALLSRALRASSQRGLVLVAAAGNGGPKAPPVYPAAHPDVIAVTAVDAAMRIYDKAATGPHVAAAAPGVDILVPTPGGGYQQSSGTSFAAAYVSGTAALLRDAGADLTADALRTALTTTARDLGRKGRDDIFGAGLIDAAAALTLVAHPAGAADSRAAPTLTATP